MAKQKTVTLLDVLESDGFRGVLFFIRNKAPNLAEMELMDLEANHSKTAGEYSPEENALIEQAIRKCWEVIDRLRKELY